MRLFNYASGNVAHGLFKGRVVSLYLLDQEGSSRSFFLDARRMRQNGSRTAKIQ